MPNKTRKQCIKNKRDCLTDAKKGTLQKCRAKTCTSKKYQSVYGASYGGNIRQERPLFY